MARSVSCSPFSASGQCVIIEDIGASNIYTLPTNVFLHYPCVMPVWPLYYHRGNNGRAWQNILASDYKRAGQPFNHHSLTEQALFLLLLPIYNVWLFSTVRFQALFPFKLPASTTAMYDHCAFSSPIPITPDKHHSTSPQLPTQSYGGIAEQQQVCTYMRGRGI